MNEPIYLVYGKDYSVEEKEGFSSTTDLNKGKKIHDELIREGLVNEGVFVDLGPISVKELSEVHSKVYIQELVQNASLFFTLSRVQKPCYIV